MTATADPPARAVTAADQAPLRLGEGLEMLGAVHGCGYRDGACLVRRADGQMVQLGPLMYGLLECVDGRRGIPELASALSEKLGRRVDEQPVVRIAQKLAAQGLLAGTEHKAPPRRNPLLALRWKILVTNPKLTRRLTAPFAVLFRPWLMWPILAAFVGVFWFVLIDKGVASATTQAFHSPGLLLLVFVLAVVSAGFHELGHAAACRYGGATPGGMGMGLYLVWPAFYTDVTDTYRLPKRDRLRVDLAGLYFNAAVAVVTMAVWLLVRADALLLLVALQVLQMVKQLSPVIRADGYHILSDATGVPDLYSHMGPTLRRLLPGRRKEPSALSGRARIIVTVWVLVVVPVLLSLMLGAVILLPRIATSAYDSGRLLIAGLPHQAENGQIIDVLASCVRLLALFLPVLGSLLVTQKIVRGTVSRARTWSRGSRVRSSVLLVAAGAAIAAMVWAWWPAGQYQPLRARQGGTLGSLVSLVSAPGAVARPAPASAGQLELAPGRHLAISMIPVGGATKRHPALFFVSPGHGHAPVAIVSSSSPTPPKTTSGSPSTNSGATSATSGGSPATAPVSATAFPFKLPPARPGETRAVAEGTKNGGVTYDVAYSLVTVSNGAPVTETNSAYALADCQKCTTVAVSFQIVLVVGHANVIAPIDEAEALNHNCPACTTTAIADQIVVTLKAQPSKALIAELDADLKRLNALSALGVNGSPAALAAAVAAVQQAIQTQLTASGLLTNPPKANSASNSPANSPSSSPTTPSSAPGNSAGSAQTSTSTAGSSSPAPAAAQSSTTTSSSAAAGSATTSTTAAPQSDTSAATTTAP